MANSSLYSHRPHFREPKYISLQLAPVELPLERNVQLKHAAVERRAESSLVRVLPVLVDDREGDVLVRRPGSDKAEKEVSDSHKDAQS